MSKIIWFTTIGWSPMAVVNTLWKYVKDFNILPDEIYLIQQNDYKINQNSNIVKNWIYSIYKHYLNLKQDEFNELIHVLRIESESFESYVTKLYSKLKQLSGDDSCEIIFDMTPGRKYMSMIMGVIGMDKSFRIKHVYYNHLVDSNFLNRPLPIIPKPVIRIFDVLQYKKYLNKNPNGKLSKTLDDAEFNKKVLEAIFNLSKDGKTIVSMRKIRNYLSDFKIDHDNPRLNKSIDGLIGNGKLIKKESKTAAHTFSGYCINPTNYSDITKELKVQNYSKKSKKHSRNHKFAISDEIDDLYINIKSQTKEIIIRKCDLPILINNFLDHEINKLAVDAAPFCMNISQIEIGSKIKLNLNKKSLRNQIPSLDVDVIERYKRDFGLYNSWNEILQSSGIIPPSNIEEIISALEEVANYDPLCGDIPRIISFDTNLHRNRFYSYIKRKHPNTINRPNLGYLFPDTVRNELGFAHKYKEIDKFISLINKHHNNNTKYSVFFMNQICNEFFNQNQFEDRKRRLGYVDYVKCKVSETSFECSSNDVTRDNDMKILSEIMNFVRNNDYRVLILSADKDFEGMGSCRNHIKPKMVEYPYKKDMDSSFLIDWDDFVEYLYVSSIWYGGLMLSEPQGTEKNEPVLTINGIWKGKNNNQWQDEYLKITGKSEFIDKISIDLEIINSCNN